MNKEKSAPRPQLVKLDKAFKLAEKWVSDMSKTSDDRSTEGELEGRPLRLGLGATVPRQSKVGPVNDPVERKLRASLGMGKRKADESIEKAKNGNDVETEDEEDDDLDSRTNLFVKKKRVPLNSALQRQKNTK